MAVRLHRALRDWDPETRRRVLTTGAVLLLALAVMLGILLERSGVLSR